MTERRATNPPEQGVAALRAGSSPDGAIDVAIEEGAPESPKPVVKVPSAAPSSQRVGGEKRVRAKVTLKIPDDEVSRPQVTPSAPPVDVTSPAGDPRGSAVTEVRRGLHPKPPEPSPPEAPPMIPMRIISIEPPPVAPKASAPPSVQPRPLAAAPVAPGSSPRLPVSPDDSWTPYQPTTADRAVSAAPPIAVAPVAISPPLAPPRPRSPSYASAPPGSSAAAPQPVLAPPRPSYHSAPSPPSAAVVPGPDSTIAMPPAPPTERFVPDSMDEIPIVTDDAPPSSSEGAFEVEDDERPTRPGVLKVTEPRLVPARPSAGIPTPLAAPVAPRVEPATVHTAITPVASPVAAYAVPPVVASGLAATATSSGPIAPTPPRVVATPQLAREQPPISITDVPPMRALAPTEPEGLEVHFEDEEPAPSGRTSEPEAEVAPEDLVSVESAPIPSRQASASTAPADAGERTGVSVSSPPAASSSQPTRGSVAPPPSVGPRSGAVQKTPRVIVPTASALAPPPMGDSAPTGRRKARPWWEELFNDDFIRTMAKISDSQIAKEVDFVEESLAVAKGAMLLDLGCGTGRHAIELTRRGYKVVGFDLSLPMLAKAAEEAQERNQKLNFVQGDMREMTFEDTFDGIYCWNTSFGFFEEDKNIQVIQRVHKALKKGGQFMLEVGNRDFIIRQAPSLAWFEGDGCICMDEMSIDWITSRMKVKRTMMMDDGRTKEIDYTVRIYSLHELGKILHDAGFRVAEVSGRTGTPGVYFGNESPRTMILAEKK